jgi:hypothetical protein
MKKYLIFSIITILVLTIVGCGGGKKSSKGYYYEWATSDSGQKVLSISNELFKGYGIVQAGYSSSVMPPFASVDSSGNTQGIAAIYTYYEENGVSNQVKSTFTCDPSVGTFTELAGEVTVFLPKKAGVQTVTASWNGYTLNIPIKVYNFVNLKYYLETGTPTGYDCDNSQFTTDMVKADIYLDNAWMYPIYGYKIVNQPISKVESATSEGYTVKLIDDFSDGFHNTIIIKTSEGRYAKINVIYYGQGIGINLFASNTNGQFEY